MPSRFTMIVAAGIALAVALVASLLLRGDGDDDSNDGGGGPTPSATAETPVVADEAWCAGWMELVAVQGQYVATQSADDADVVLAAVDSLQALGVPESLDPAGYTELDAVLDDVRASVDPSFTPTVLPSEPADVAVEGDEHEGDEHEEHGADASEAPFGAWLAQYCSV